MSDYAKTVHKPNNVVIIEKDGTKFTLREFLGNDELINIIANRVIRDLNAPLPKKCEEGDITE